MSEAKYTACPTCNSSAPHLHPAAQFEGEVELCVNDFHLRPTLQNRQEFVDAVLAKRAAIKKATP